jgi:hypothetical protein
MVCIGKIQAQVDSFKIKNKFKDGVELGSYFSLNEKIPFWQKSNQFGGVPQNGNSVYFRQMIASHRDSSRRSFTADYCLDLVTIIGEKPLIILPEAFVRFNFKGILLTGGRIKSVHGLVDTTLSSGSVTWSSNSLPIPEIRLSIPNYKKLFVKWL